jgi:hypothetical protein
MPGGWLWLAANGDQRSRGVKVGRLALTLYFLRSASIPAS